jgi:3',5'-cyclic AMP phosphodiesterase CpdA
VRLVAIADTHCRWDALEPLPGGDVLIVAGDLLARGTLDELKSAAEWLRRLPFRTKLLAAGNIDPVRRTLEEGLVPPA